MIKKYAKLKRLQAESGELQNELASLKAEANNLHWKIELIKQDSDDDTDPLPLTAKLQELRAEIVKIGKKNESLAEGIQDLSTTLLNHAIRQSESRLDEDYAALNILKSDYDRHWRLFANDESDPSKRSRVESLRKRKTEVQDKIRESEHLLRMLEVNSMLSLDKFFKQERESVTA